MKAKRLMLLTGMTTLFLSVATLNGSLKAQNSTGTTPGSDTTNTTQGQIELTRTAIRAQRADIVKQALPLTEAESKKFWPLYREYQSQLTSVNDGLVELLADYAENYNNLSNAQAETLLDNYLKFQRQKLDLEQQYVRRFRQILSGKKVTRLFQLENKMDAVLNYDLAGTVPVVK